VRAFANLRGWLLAASVLSTAACSGDSANGGAGNPDTGSGGTTVTGSGGSPANNPGGSGGSGSTVNPGSGGNIASGAGGTGGALGDGSTSTGGSGAIDRQPDGGGTAQSDAGDAGASVMPSADDLIAAPDGQDAAAGTLDAPTTLTAAITRIGAGHSIYLRGGSYAYAVQVTIARDNSGDDGQQKTIAPYQNEAPVLDFSSQPYGSSGNARGLQIEGSYWHVIGLEVMNSADNGIYVAGNSNVIEGCVVHGNHDTGLQLGRYASSATSQADWPSNNLILNCESYDNYDAPPGSGENADGFAAKLTVGTGNVFRGCVSHNNIDDGWDLYTKSDTGAIGGVTIDQCIAHHNGTLTDGTTNTNGDRNGFKLGGEKIAVAHTVTRSVAFANGKDGFTWNSNPGAIRLSNTLSIDNGASNYRFGDNSTQTQAVFTNNVSFRTASGGDDDKTIGTDAANSNCWLPNTNSKGLMVTAADFAHPLANPTIARKADGSIDFAPFALAGGSDLANAGAVPAGTLPFDAAAYYKDDPDLGAVETQ
jgi:hypothetical protein